MERKTDFECILKASRCNEPDYVPVAELAMDPPGKRGIFG